MQATTAVDSKPHRPIKAKLAVLTALLSLAAALQAAPAGAMVNDDAIGVCESVPGFSEGWNFTTGQPCTLGEGAGAIDDAIEVEATLNPDAIVGEPIYVNDKKAHEPKPARSRCPEFGCLRRDQGRSAVDRDLFGSPDEPRRGSVGKKEKAAKAQGSKKALHTKGECLESARGEENVDVIERMRELWKRKHMAHLLSREASLALAIPDLDKRAAKTSLQIDALLANGSVDAESEKGQRIATLEADLAELERRLVSSENEAAEVQRELSTAREIHGAIKKGLGDGDDAWTSEECLKILFANDDKPAGPAKLKR